MLPNQTFALNPTGVTFLAGPNNAGKSSLLQALAIWEFCRTVLEIERGKESLLPGYNGQGLGMADDEFSLCAHRDHSTGQRSISTADLPRIGGAGCYPPEATVHPASSVVRVRENCTRQHCEAASRKRRVPQRMKVGVRLQVEARAPSVSGFRWHLIMMTETLPQGMKCRNRPIRWGARGQA